MVRFIKNYLFHIWSLWKIWALLHSLCVDFS